MTITINIQEGTTQLQQMAAQLGLKPDRNVIRFPPQFGEGFCRLYELPFQIQLHHYQYCLDRPIEVQSFNRIDNGMYIVNINLSQKLLSKQIGNAPQYLSKEGENGVMYYSPGNDSKGKNEIGLPFEVVFFSIPKPAIEQFLASIALTDLEAKLPFCHYAELDDTLAGELSSVLNTKKTINLFQQHGKLMEILGKVLAIFHQQKWHSKRAGLRMEDVEKLLEVKGILKSHIFGTPPTIDQIAQQLNMSPSQLKYKFKSLFGNTIYQYYLQSKLNTAKSLLSNGEGTISEIGYKLGYSNISQFSAQFKKRFGFSPSKLKT